IPLSYSLLCGMVIYEFLYRKKAHIQKTISVILCVFILSSSFFAAFPLLTGDMRGALKPKDLPSDYVYTYNWIEQQDPEGKYKTTVWPARPPWFAPNARVKEDFYHRYVQHLVRENRTEHLGKELGFLNIRYLLLRGDAMASHDMNRIISNLLAQKDLELVMHKGSLIVFENPYCVEILNIPTLHVLLFEGLEKLTTLNSFPSFNILNSCLIFPTQMQEIVIQNEIDAIVSTNKVLNDLAFLLTHKKYVISPFGYTNNHNPSKLWSKAGTNDPLHGPWHPYLERRGIDNWDFDYGRGLVFTWATLCTLEIPFTLKETDEYVFLARLFQNQQAGKIGIQLDDKGYTVNTKDQLNEFTWKEIDTLWLEKGSHKITLTNIEGFNAVNLFALIPKQEYQNVQNQLEQLLQDKRVIYILEAESDLYHQNGTISNKYCGEASNGIVLELTKASKAWGEVEIIKPGNYTLVIRSRGNLIIKIDEKEYEISSPQLNWTYIGSINLEKGKHVIEIANPMQSSREWSFRNEPSDLDVIWLYSTQKENETLEEIFTPDGNPAEVVSYQKIDPTKYLVKVNATKPFMLSFAEAYDPLWVAYVNGERIQSIPLYGVINGFWINQTGLLEITIEYEPQKWFYIGSIISVTTLIACATYLTYGWVRNKAISERVKKWLKPKSSSTKPISS
ncbi:MAG: hypothetical protein FGF48_10300, partial [Candidatus Brockarchaeota archaeon]|nr:hypothetical protein [Candidatus Brockarchaeota archaeon]